MSMDFEEISNGLAYLNSALTNKGYLQPNCDMNVNLSEITIWIRSARDGELSGVHEFVESEDFENAFSAASDLIDALKPVEDFKKQQAVKQFGRAVDGLREAGIEADFVDPLSEALQAMTSNLLTHEVTS